MVSLQIKLLGSLQVVRDAQPVRRFRSQKTVALLGYLVVEVRPIARETLAGLFWGNESLTQARGELRRSLHNLTTLLPGCFLADRRTIQFTIPVNCNVDIYTFDRLFKEDDIESLQAAADLVRG